MRAQRGRRRAGAQTDHPILATVPPCEHAVPTGEHGWVAGRRRAGEAVRAYLHVTGLNGKTYTRHLTETASPGAWTVIDGATAYGTAAARSYLPVG